MPKRKKKSGRKVRVYKISSGEIRISRTSARGSKTGKTGVWRISIRGRDSKTGKNISLPKVLNGANKLLVKEVYARLRRSGALEIRDTVPPRPPPKRGRG